MESGMKTIEQQIESSGWTLDIMHPHNPYPDYRAVMGGFCTPWRGAKEQVLEDVKAYQIKPNLEPQNE